MQYGNIEKSFEELGNNIKTNLPKVKLPLSEKQEDPLVSKLRKWMLIILSGLVAGTAVILIIRSIILKLL